jgi:[ribosomal protein S18]-alanine N-acetyltransferase
MTCRIVTVGGAAAAALAVPLSELHALCFPDDPWAPAAIAEIARLAGFFGSVAFFCEHPAGLGLAQGLGEECEILSLGVAPGHRRRGIGLALLEALVVDAGRRGSHRLFLEVAADNIAARALYGAFGFIQIGRRRNYYRRGTTQVDALVLRRLVST